VCLGACQRAAGDVHRAQQAQGTATGADNAKQAERGVQWLPAALTRVNHDLRADIVDRDRVLGLHEAAAVDQANHLVDRCVLGLEHLLGHICDPSRAGHGHLNLPAIDHLDPQDQLRL